MKAKRNDACKYEIRTGEEVLIARTPEQPPAPVKKPIITAENAKRFTKDVCYCAGISLASTLLIQGGMALVNKVRSKISSKKGDDKK